MPEPRIRLKCLVGRYRGQILDYPKSVAENLLATGHAKYPDTETGGSETATVPKDETRWKLSISPEAYLERYPDGPNADTARKLRRQE